MSTITPSTGSDDMWRTVDVFARLRWRLLRGAIRRGGTDQVGAVLSIVASGLVGTFGGLAAYVVGRDAEYRSLVVLIAVGLVVAIVGFGTVAGVTQPIDPRVIAAEPLTARERSAGLLAGAAFGPPGLAGIMIGLGLGIGSARGAASIGPIFVAVAALLVSLLLVARTATNLLGVLIARRPRLGQLVAGISALVFYGMFQFIPGVVAELDQAGRADLAAVLRWSPPGQHGHAIAVAAESPTRALAHTLLGAVWLVPLAAGFIVTTERLATTVRSAGTSNAKPQGRFGAFIRQLCGRGRAGTIAWRSLITRFRHPRTALETGTGAAIGLAVILAPALLRDNPGSGAMLTGGAVQLAVILMAGNSLGSDGPALAYEMLAGASAFDLAAGKARSIVIVAAPLALIGPLVAAALTEEWQYLPAGFGIGVGGLLAGAGAATLQSALVPIAIPESDNPFATGESGKGILAAGLVVVVLSGLALATLPVGLVLFWALDRGHTEFVTGLALATMFVGMAMMRAGVALATRRLQGRDADFIDSVTPAR